MTAGRKPILSGLSTTELEALLRSEGEPAYRGRQVGEWVYRHHARSFDDMSSIPAGLRAKLAGKYDIGRENLVTVAGSGDGTAKLLLEMADGARIETVALPYADRLSCCVSTQVGCAIGCLFCASGQGGFVRNLQPGEIVNQVLAVEDLVHSGDISTSPDNRRVDHVVFMGMGEPLLNYDNTLKAVRLLNSEVGIGIRHLTVSTVGIVPGIYRLAKEAGAGNIPLEDSRNTGSLPRLCESHRTPCDLRILPAERRQRQCGTGEAAGEPPVRSQLSRQPHPVQRRPRPDVQAFTRSEGTRVPEYSGRVKNPGHPATSARRRDKRRLRAVTAGKG